MSVTADMFGSLQIFSVARSKVTRNVSVNIDDLDPVLVIALFRC